MNFATLSIDNNTFNYYIVKDNNIIFESNLNNINFLDDILSLRIDYIYVWHANILFAYIDNYAIRNKLFNYSDIEIDKFNHKKRVNQNTISIKDGAGCYYQRKIWLKTYKFNSTDRHKRLSSTTFINFSNYFGGKSLNDSLKAFNIKNNFNGLYQLLYNFDSFVYKITQIHFLNNGRPCSWSIGGIAKKYYLKLYNNNSANPELEYKNSNPQNKEFEYLMRSSNLLLPGILYLKDKKVHNNLIKYDKNSLFPYNEKNCPFLGVPRECNIEEYNTDKNYEYIFYFKNITLKLKNDMISIFKEPNKCYKGINKDIIFLEEQSFFGFYLDRLEKFYNIDFEEVKLYKLRKTPDYAIKNYVDILYNYKIKSKLGYNINPGLYTLIKFLLNNLHGKFAQLTLFEEYTYKINKNNIISRKVQKINDQWEKSHFDYLRGAWIYAKSQTQILDDLLTLSKEYNLQEIIYYIDTDCLITNLSPLLFQQLLNISDIDLGAYKIEETYKQFRSLAPKVYFGYTFINEFKLTCAGMNKEEAKEYLKNNYPYSNYLKILRPYFQVPTTIIKRTPTGAQKVTEFKPICGGFKGNEKEGVLYETSLNG